MIGNTRGKKVQGNEKGSGLMERASDQSGGWA